MLSLDWISGGWFVLGLGLGDCLEEFVVFGEDLESRVVMFCECWLLLCVVLLLEIDEWIVVL